MVAVGFGQMFDKDWQHARMWCRREFQMQTCRIFLIDFESLQFFELFDAALHLHGFCGFVAKSFDKIFGVGNHFLLIFVGAQLLFAAFGAQLFVLGVRHFVVVDFSERNFDGARCYRIEESAVVAHEQHCRAACSQKIFEPLYRFDVEMVSRFVEQQQIGAFQQYFCQFDAHTPTAAKFGSLPAEVGTFEAKSEQRFFDFGLHIGCAK